jgi:hypothetical protein
VIFITLGKFRAKPTKEATSEVSKLMKANMMVNGIVSTETMVALTREEALKLL